MNLLSKMADGSWRGARVAGALLAGVLGARLAAGEAAAVGTTSRATVIVVVGTGGEERFDEDFALQARLWQQAGERAGTRFLAVGLDAATPSATDRDRLREALAAEPKEGVGELWLVLAGHGTFDGKEARFNLRGPDLAASELAAWLQPFRRPLAVIDAASASAPWLAALSGPGRIVVTATRSGNELNYARFGKYLAAAISDPAADLDRDGQTSLLEAFLSASQQVAEFYRGESRLATEHALIDDNGDGLGTPADWFRGVRPTRKPQEGKSVDGTRAQQFCLVRSASERQMSPEARARRDELELTLARLRESKAQTPEADYARQLEALLLELARLYEPAGK